MNKAKNNLILFSIGAVGYGAIEILWRGFTHPSMLAAGGISFCFFSKLGEKLKAKSLLVKGIAGSAIITLIELIFGIIFNIILKKNVWDYSKMPLNFYGQICVLYSFFWSILSIVFIPIANFITKKIN